jgi:formaldehyde-activating enzyme involved in methanogenesis
VPPAATAIAGTAYTNAITNKEYGVGVVLAIFGLGLTAITAVAGLREVKSASQVEHVLGGLQAEVARRVGIESIRREGSEPILQQRRLSATVAVGLGALFNIGALLFAVTH